MQSAYFRLIDLLASRYDQADVLREERDLPRLRGRRSKTHGRYDVDVAYALSHLGLNNSCGFIGKQPIIPHSQTDVIKDKVAKHGWFPGVPSLQKLREMDRLTLTEQERDESLQEHKEIAYRLEIIRATPPEPKPIRTLSAVRPDIRKAIAHIYKNGMSLSDLMLKTRFSLNLLKQIIRSQKVKIRGHRFAPLTPQTG